MKKKKRKRNNLKNSNNDDMNNSNNNILIPVGSERSAHLLPPSRLHRSHPLVQIKGGRYEWHQWTRFDLILTCWFGGHIGKGIAELGTQQPLDISCLRRDVSQGTEHIGLTLNVLCHTIPHDLCEVNDVHGLQCFVSTHSGESGSVLFINSSFVCNNKGF